MEKTFVIQYFKKFIQGNKILPFYLTAGKTSVGSGVAFE